MVFNKRISLVIFCLYLALLTALTGAETVSAATYYCHNCSECSSLIQNNASAGDTVRLNASIVNQSGTCIDFGGTDDITFTCDGHSVGGDGDNDGSGIYLSSGSDGNTVANCTVTDFYSGVYLNYSDDCNLSGLVADNNSFGIQISYSNYGYLYDSTANNNFINIYLSYSEYCNLTNISSNNGLFYGVYLEYSNHSQIINLTANYAGNGASIRYSDFCVLRDIVANNNDYGIYLSRSNYCSLSNITSNSNSDFGILLFNSNHCEVREVIANDDVTYGMQLYNSHDIIIDDFYSDRSN